MASKIAPARIEQQAKWRDRIKTGMLLNKLQDQSLAEFVKTEDDKGKPTGPLRGTYVDPETGEVRDNIVPMTAQQIKIAEMLLSRTLPAIKIVEQDINVSGGVGFAVIAPEKISEEEWERRFGKPKS